MPENVTGFQPTGNINKSLIDLTCFDMLPRRSPTFPREEPIKMRPYRIEHHCHHDEQPRHPNCRHSVTVTSPSSTAAEFLDTRALYYIYVRRRWSAIANRTCSLRWSGAVERVPQWTIKRLILVGTRLRLNLTFVLFHRPGQIDPKQAECRDKNRSGKPGICKKTHQHEADRRQRRISERKCH